VGNAKRQLAPVLQLDDPHRRYHPRFAEATAPEVPASGEPEPDAEEVDELRRRWWSRVRTGWSRVPTPLVATVIGVFLSAWLFPAFTRQWDDRQKARDFQASVVSDVVSATAKVLDEAQRASDHRRKRGHGTVPVTDDTSAVAAARQWSIASLRIKARLRIYFGDDGKPTDQWAVVSSAVATTLFFASGAESYLIDATPLPASLKNLLWEYGASHDLGALRHALLEEEDDLSRIVLATHVDGYNTRWRDVAKDLFPFV
jgi:hypothetical protein